MLAIGLLLVDPLGLDKTYPASPRDSPKYSSAKHPQDTDTVHVRRQHASGAVCQTGFVLEGGLVGRQIRKRALTSALVITISIFLNFVPMHVAPGDPITLLSGQYKPSPQAIAALKAKYGLDQPISTRWFGT